MPGAVKPRDLVVLWARAAGMCSHPDCKIRLVLEAVGRDRDQAVGEAAHIVARSPLGPRGDPTSLPFQLHHYENLILLCGHHHAMVDRQPDAHPVDVLRAWKAEHEAWVRASTNTVPTSLPWTAIVQEEEHRIDIPEARSALGPGNHAATTLELRTPPAAAHDWSAAAARERTLLQALLRDTPADLRRFAVFSLARIPLAIHLGFILGDRGRLAIHHYDRDRATWHWPAPNNSAASDLTLRARKLRSGRDAAIRVSLSAPVPPQHLKLSLDIEISVARPNVRWLTRQAQLTALARVFTQALEQVRDHPGVRLVHLFFAGPAAAAITLGRASNPRMNPPIQLYEYTRPHYHPAIVLTGDPLA